MEKVIAWLDVEANGKNPEIDALLEVGLVITDFHGNELSHPYSSLVKVSNLDEVIAKADPIVQRMHDDSNLWRDLWTESSKAPKVIDEELCSLLETFTSKPLFFLGGNSITLDRGFASVNLPNFSSIISHMSVDATSIASVLQERFKAPRFKKQQKHRALEDVYDSMDEYRYYLHFLSTLQNDR